MLTATYAITFTALTRAISMETEPKWISIPQPQTISYSRQGYLSPSQLSAICVPNGSPESFNETAQLLAKQISYVGNVPQPSLSCAGTRNHVILLVNTSIAPEGYEILIDTARVEIAASDAAGFFFAGQQILQNFVSQQGLPTGKYAGAPSMVERSLHIDNGRKQYSKAFFEKQIRDMAYIGLNTLQLHFSENEGFGIECKLYPQLASRDALSHEDVIDLIKLGQQYHVKIVPSLDAPGHCQAILNLFPELQLRDRNDRPVRGAFDITNPAAIAKIDEIIDEFAQLFKNTSTKWNIGVDEFVDFRHLENYPILTAAAEKLFGPGATTFDLITHFANNMTAKMRSYGFSTRVWNDGMFRSTHTTLDSTIDVTWWTNWDEEMVLLQNAVPAGNNLVNYHDSVMYYVLGEAAGYKYPTAKRFWDIDWKPGVFPTYLSAGIRYAQNIIVPYPRQLLGASFAIWSDRPEAQTEEQVDRGIRSPLTAMAERVWNDGSGLCLDEFNRIADVIGTSPYQVASPTFSGVQGAVVDANGLGSHDL